MDRSKEIIDVLSKLDSNVQKGNETYQQLFDFHKINAKTQERQDRRINDKIDVIVKQLTSKRQTRTEHLLSKISSSLQNVPALLTEIRLSIDRGTSIQAAMQAAVAGQGDSIASLKTLSTQKSSSVVSKLDSVFRSANKSVPSPSEHKAEEKTGNADLAGIKPKDLKLVAAGLVSIGAVIKTYIHALKEYAKIQDKVKVDQLSNDIVKTINSLSLSINKSRISKKRVHEVVVGITTGMIYFITHISKIKKSTIKHFNHVADAVGKTFSKLMDILTKIIVKKERYETALMVLTNIVKVIKKMQIGFLVAALLFPLIPFAMFSFARMFQVAGMVGYFGIPFVRGILVKGAQSLSLIGNSIIKMSLAFWLMGRIMKRYDVPGIVLTLENMFGLFYDISAMHINYKKALQNITVFNEFISGVGMAFVSFDTIMGILGRYKRAKVIGILDNMELIILKSFELFNTFTQFQTSGRKVRKSIEGFMVLFENIPYIIDQIGNITEYIKKNGLDKKAVSMQKVVEPVMKLLETMTPKHVPKLGEILTLKMAYKAILGGANILVDGLNKLDDKKLKHSVSKMTLVTKVFDQMFLLFKNINLHTMSIFKASKNAKHMAEVGSSSFKMALMFALTAPLAPIAMLGLVFLVTTIKFMRIAAMGSIKLLKLAMALIVLSPALLLYSLALFGAGMLMSKIDYKSLFMGLGAMIVVSLSFKMIGRSAIRIMLGAAVTLIMSIALLAWGLSLMLYSSIVKSIDIGTLLGGALVMTAYAVVFGLIGSIGAGTVALGSLSAILMGVGLAAFSVGLLIYSAAVKTADVGTLLMGALVMAAYGAVFTLIGIGVTALYGAPLIGALAVMMMGAGLILFGMGLVIFGEALKRNDIGTLLMGAVVITAYGVAFAIATIGMFGAISVALMGVALLLFSPGILAFGTVMENVGLKNLLFGALAIVAFGIVFAILGVGSLFIIPGAIAVIAMSLALPLFSGAMGVFSLLPEINVGNVLIMGLALIVFAIGFAFIGALSILIIPGTVAVVAISASIPLFILALSQLKDLNKVEWGAIGKFAVLMGVLGVGYTLLGAASIAIIPGTIAVKLMGESLKSIMGTLKETFAFEWDKVPLDKIQKTLTGLAAAFAIVGADGKSGLGGFFTGMLNAVGIGPNNVKRGIDSVMNAGKALISISEGLSEWNKKAGDMLMGPAGDQLLSNITKTVNMIRTAFAAVGNDQVDFLGITVKESSVEKGINSVRGIGVTLKSIADGLAAWGNLQTMGLDDAKLLQIAKNIDVVLTTITSKFEAIGKTSDSGFLGMGIFTSTDAEKGIKSVKGIGSVMSEIAEGVKAFASLEKMGFKPNSFDPKTKGTIAYNMMEIITVVTKLFGELGSKGAMHDVNGKKVWLADESIKRGIDSTKGVGDILSSIGNSLKVYTTIDDKQMELIKKNIKDIIGVVSEVFAEIGSGKNDMIKSDAVKSGVQAVQGVGKELEGIAKSLQPFMDMQKSNIKIDIDKLKRNIRDIVSTTIIFLGAVGAIQQDTTEAKKLGLQYFGPEYWLMKSYFIKDGVGVLKTGMDGLEFMQKAGELVKSLSENKKNINFESLKTYLIDTIRVPLGVLGALGIAQSEDSNNRKLAEGMFGADYILMSSSLVEKGIELAKKVKDGIESISGIVSALNKPEFTATDIKGKKQIIIDTIKTPIDIIAALMKEHGYDNVMKWMNNFIPVLKSKLDSLFDSSDKNYNGSIGAITGDLKKFIRDIINAKIDNKQMDSMNKIVNFFERWAKLDDPFEKFTKTFAKHLGDFKEYVKQVNSIDIERMKSFSDLNYKMTELVKVDPSQFTANAANIKQIIGDIQTNGQQQANAQAQNTGSIFNSINQGFSSMFGGGTNNEKEKEDKKKEEAEHNMSSEITAVRVSIDRLYDLFKDGTAGVKVKTGHR